MDSQPPSDRRLTPSQAAYLQDACKAFAAAWRTDSPPRVEDYLASCDPRLVVPLLESLLGIEWDHRRACGESLDAAEYVRRFPDHSPLIQQLWAAGPGAIGGHHDPTHQESTVTNQRTQPPSLSLAMGLHIRCPHCQNPVEIATDASLSEITCSSCGSQFSLIDESRDTRSTSQLTTIGHFDLVERLGIGGFGTVWKARDVQLDRTVALKIPRKGQLSSLELEKFLREARAAAQLKHPNIVSVYEVGRHEDTIYIVSDIVRGVSLSQWLFAKRPTAREAAALCVKIAAALHHAHGKGIVHRDLKPQNILIDGQGEPHLTDFGLAKRESGEVTITIDGQVLGTPAYMAPEQARGEGHTADARADVYSLGVVLFRLLTGELPFRGTTDMLLMQVLHDEPPSPRRLNRTIPRDLETITLKCLEKDPVRRYPTAAALQDDLTRFLRDEPVRARRVGALTKVWRWRRRNPAIAGLVAAVACALLLGTIVATAFALRLARSEQEKTQLLAGALMTSSRAIRQARPEGYRDLVRDLVRQALELDTAIDVDQLRREAVGAMGDFVGLPPIDHDRFPAEVTAMTLHPRAEYLAVGLKTGEIQLLEPLSGDGIGRLVEQTGAVRALAFSPSGDRLVAVCGETGPDSLVAEWQRAGSDRWTLTRQSALGHDFQTASITPDAQWLLTRTALEIRVWDLAQEAELTSCTDEELTAPGRQPDPDGTIAAVALSPDGAQLAVAYVYEHEGAEESGFCLWDIQQRRVVHRQPVNQGWPYAEALVFSPDGQQLVYGSDQALALYELPSLRQRWMRRVDSVQAVCFRWDNHLSASTTIRGAVRVWNVATGNEVASLTQPLKGPPRGRLTFSRDGRCLAASSSHAVRVWNFSGAQERRLLAGHADAIPTLAFHPTRDLLASGSHDGSVAVWDVSSGEKVLQLPQDGHVQCVRFNPDGSLLAVALVSGQNQPVTIWDVATGTCLYRAEHRLELAYALAFTSRGDRLFASGKSGIAGWSLPARPHAGDHSETLEADFSIPGLYCLDIALSQDDRYLAWPDKVVDLRLWSLPDRVPAPLPTVTMLQGWHGLAFHPDSDVLLVSSDGVVEAWRAGARKPSFSLGVSGTFRTPHIALSADGTWLAGLVEPETVSIWDTAAGKETYLLRPERTAIWSLAWGGGGSKLACGLNDGGLVLWDLSKLRQELARWGLPAAPARGP